MLHLESQATLQPLWLLIIIRAERVQKREIYSCFRLQSQESRLLQDTWRSDCCLHPRPPWGGCLPQPSHAVGPLEGSRCCVSSQPLEAQLGSPCKCKVQKLDVIIPFNSSLLSLASLHYWAGFHVNDLYPEMQWYPWRGKGPSFSTWDKGRYFSLTAILA